MTTTEIERIEQRLEILGLKAFPEPWQGEMVAGLLLCQYRVFPSDTADFFDYCDRVFRMPWVFTSVGAQVSAKLPAGAVIT